VRTCRHALDCLAVTGYFAVDEQAVDVLELRQTVLEPRWNFEFEVLFVA
jgi:hypothetical protein